MFTLVHAITQCTQWSGLDQNNKAYFTMFSLNCAKLLHTETFGASNSHFFDKYAKKMFFPARERERIRVFLCILC